MHPNVGVTLDSWNASIKELRNTRKNEIAGTTDTPGIQYGKSHSQQGNYFFLFVIRTLISNIMLGKKLTKMEMAILLGNCVHYYTLLHNLNDDFALILCALIAFVAPHITAKFF